MIMGRTLESQSLDVLSRLSSLLAQSVGLTIAYLSTLFISFFNKKSLNPNRVYGASAIQNYQRLAFRRSAGGGELR